MRLLNAIDRKDTSVLASRLVSLTIGPLTTIAIGLFFTAETQGIYYSFGSIVGALMLFESGVGGVIVQLASRESKSGIAQPGFWQQGPTKLAALLKFAIQWYWSLAGIGAFIVCTIGFLTFGGSDLTIEWRAPWIWLCATSAFSFMQLPFLNFLEGSGALISVYKYRLVRSLVQSTALLLCVVSGLGLWSVPLAATAGVISGVVYLARYARGFLQLLRHAQSDILNWRRDVMPFQGRVAISWVAGYFGVSFLTPALLATQGPISAGRLGMTIALFTACTQLSASFIQSQAPTFGQLVAGGHWHELDRLFRKKAALSIGVASILIFLVCGTFTFLQIFDFRIASRVLDITTMTFLGVGFIAYHSEGVLAFFMRAQMKEPYYILEAIAALISVPLTMLLSKSLGTQGAVGTFVGIHVALVLPIAVIILQRNRRIVLIHK